MVRFRHIIAGAVAAMISVAAQAGWQPVEEGLVAPKARMLFTSGQWRTLDAFRGKVVLLNLWATWCGPCLMELPTFEALEKELAPQGLVVIPLSIERGVHPDELKAFLEDEGLNLPHVALDATKGMTRGLDYRGGIPVTFLIDRKGVIRARYVGSSDWTKPPRKDRVLEILAEGKGR